MAREETFGDEHGNPTRLELLKLDVDTRMVDLWREAEEIAYWNLQNVADFMRAAYGKGYCDALGEPTRGQLTQEHGYKTPQRPAIFPDSEPEF